MSDKQEEYYAKLIHHLDIDSNEFLMIGNSLKSLPSSSPDIYVSLCIVGAVNGKLFTDYRTIFHL